MSPSRQGSQRSVPSTSRRTTDQPSCRARATTAATSARFERSRSSSAVVASGSGRCRAARPRVRPGPPRGPLRARTYSGWESGSATMSSRKMPLTTSITGRAVRKLRVSRCGVAPNARAGPQEGGDVGAPESVDRLLGVADDEQAPGVDRRARPTAACARVGIARREQRREVALDRIGVLELVEEEPGVARAQPAADVPAVLGVTQHRRGRARADRGTRARPARRRRRPPAA